MKRKILVALLAISACVSGAFGLAACNNESENNDKNHTHDYGTGWVTDKDFHWRECKNDGCDEKEKFKTAHIDSNADGKCDVCLYEINSGTPSAEHKLIPVEETAATCTTNGNIAYYICGDCGKWFSDKYGKNEIIDKSSVITSYELTPIARIEATCEKDGNKAYYVCDDCGKWYSDRNGNYEIKDKTSVILPKGHKLSPVAETKETCTADGNIAYYTCSGCDKWFVDKYAETEITDKSSVVINKKGHDFTPVAENAATCWDDGNIAYYTCGTCKKWYFDKNGERQITDKTSVILPKGHKLSPVAAKAETCTDDGNKAYFVCDDCGRWFWDKDGQDKIYYAADIVIAKGHKYEKGVCKACAQPQPPTQGLNYTFTANGYEVSGIGTAKDKDIIIPSTYNGKAVTSIGDEAFSSSDIKFVLIPDSVTSIGNEAFYSCGSLSEIVIPDSVTSIGGKAFEWCYSLPHSNYDNAEYVGSGNNPYLILVKAKNTWITSCVINDKTKFIDSQAFWNCGELTSVTIGKGVTSIGYYAFDRCTSLTSLILPDQITNIEEGAFRDCHSLTSVILPKGVTVISNATFKTCIRLTEITIPNSVTTIGDEAFYNCGVTSIYFPEGVMSIGSAAFKFCYYLTNISLPDSVTSIVSDAFDFCDKLQYNEYDNAKYLGNGNNPNLYLVKAKNEQITLCTISDKTKFIGPNAFSNCTELTSITIPDSVTVICERAFYNCSSLKSVVIPNSVNTIGDKAFSDCASLMSVTIGNGVTCMSDIAFGDKNYIFSENKCLVLYCEAVSKPDSWGSKWNNSYPVVWNCKNNDMTENGYIYIFADDLIFSLKDGKVAVAEQSTTLSGDVEIPQNIIYKNITYTVTAINAWAFQRCSGLTSVIIPDSVTAIEQEAFSYCNKLTSVELGNGVKTIGLEAFLGCGIVSITLPESMTSIGYKAFSGCRSLTNIIIPDSVTSFESWAFQNCTSLKKITIPSSVTNLGFEVFSGCAELVIINYKGTQEQWLLMEKSYNWSGKGDITIFYNEG